MRGAMESGRLEQGFAPREVQILRYAERLTREPAAVEKADIGRLRDAGLDAKHGDVASHRKFREKYDLNFPLLSDPDHAVAEVYGAWGRKKLYGREYEGILRTTFIIDPAGRIARVYEKVRPAEHAAELLAELEDLERA